jgi:RNA polymerase primary sigma factor
LNAAYPENSQNETLLDMLLERAELQGHLTMDDLEEVIPRSGAYQEKLEEVVGLLTDQGIEVLYADEENESVADPLDADTDMDPLIGVERVPSDDTISMYLREMSKVP